MRIVLASNNGGPEGVAFVTRLRDLGHEVVGLVQDGDRTPPERRGDVSLSMPLDHNVRLLALREGIPIVWLERRSRGAYEFYRRLRPDLLLVSCFSKIFTDEFLEIAKVGNVNVHPALLPRHRGPHPHAHVILAGDSETGVTFHGVTKGIDAGHILLQAHLAVAPEDTSGTLRERCSGLATARLGDILSEIATCGVCGTPQDESEATYEPRFTRERARIDWSQSAENIERQTRAGAPYDHAWFMDGDARVLVEGCRVGEHVNAAPGTIVATKPHPVVATNDGTLEISDAQVAPPDDDDDVIYAVVPWPRRRLQVSERFT